MQKLLVFLTLLALTVYSSGQGDYRIYLKSGVVHDSQLMAPDQVRRSDLAANGFRGQCYLILQFDAIPGAAGKAALQAKGITLLEYLPDYAFLASVTQGADLDAPGLRRVGFLQPSYKLSRELAEGIFPAHALASAQEIDLLVLPYRNLSRQTLKTYLAEQGFTLLPDPAGPSSAAVRVNVNDISSLAGLPPVMYVEPVEAPPVPDDQRGRTVHRANTLSQGPGLGYDGTGITMAIADDGGVNHIDFKGRLNDLTASQGGTHGDGTAGIATGAGNLDPTMTGMGTGAFLYLYDIGGYPHITNAIPNFYNLETVITSTSYSEVCGGLYSATARDLDLGVDSLNQLLHIFSAGNSASSSCSNIYGNFSEAGGYRYGNITGGRKAAKSSIATANLYYDDDRALSSSRGPCEDGRLKPDISAHGQGQMTTAPGNTYMSFGGTSAAAPGVGGVTTMLYQAYTESNNGAYPSASLIKGILLNTADELGRPGPDYDFGWGRINARRALEVLQNQQYMHGSVSQNNTQNHVISVPAGVSQLKVMVYWKDPAGSPTAAKALVNDLDMTLSPPGGGTVRPWTLSIFPSLDSLQRPAQRGIDRVNNMEQVTIDNPGAGNYTVQVAGTTVPMGPQGYHVIYSFVRNGITVTYPLGGEGLVPGETETLRWDAFGNGGSFSLSYSTNNGTSWTNIASNVAGSQRYYDWTVPNTVTGNARIRVTRGSVTGQSAASFSILGLPGNVRFVPTGIFSAEVSWNAVNGANRYDVFLLGAKYMDSIGTTSTLSFTLNNLINGQDYWIAVRARNSSGIVGRRSNAILYNHQPVSSCGGCIVQICEFPYEESFENGLGGWCQEINDDIDWIRNSGGTPSSNTGPGGASNGSYYLYVEASLPNYPAKVATLGSPCFNLAGFSAANLTFSYHMYGASMGRLDLLVSTDQGNTWSSPIWSRQGNQGTSWQTQTLSLNSYTGGSLALRFRATTGNDFTSDIALDRVLINGTQTGSPLSLNIQSQDITCFGAQNGSANAQVSGGASPYAYFWSTGDSTASVSGLGIGDYTLVVLDSQQCAVWDSFSVQEPPPIVATTSSTQVTCHGDSNATASINAQGGVFPYSFSWTNGSNGTTAAGLPAGIFYVTVTDAAGCTYLDSVTITQPPPLALNATHTDISCFGNQDGSASITPSGGNGSYNIIWSTGSSSPAISNLNAGTYQVLLADGKGCFTSGSVTIQQPPLLTLAMQSQDVTCYGDGNGQITATPAGGVGGYRFLWTGGVTDSTLAGLQPGLYSVTVSDSNGCQAADSARITEPPALVLTTSFSDPKCFDSADGFALAGASGGNGGITYSWSNGANDSILTQLGAGTYVVTATDVKGCAMRDTLTLTAPPALVLTLTANDASGPGANDGAIDLSISGGTLPYAQILWSTGDTTEDLSGLAPGVYHVTVTDANGCVIRDSVVVGSATSLSGLLPVDQLKVFPNPARETLNLSFRLDQALPTQARIYDLQGRLLLTRPIPGSTGSHEVAIDVSSFATGPYFLEVGNQRGRARVKWVKF